MGVQFIFCMRGLDDRHLGLDDDIGVIPNGFEDRVEGRCLVIKGWAPTSGYTAVGAFLTHYGWNSIDRKSVV